jgi:hypothetical protein
MTPLEIVNSLKQRVTQGDVLADRLYADAIRSALHTDWTALAFIANMVAGRSGDASCRMNELIVLADLLVPMRNCE